MLSETRSAKRSDASLRVPCPAVCRRALVLCLLGLGGLASGCDRPSGGEATILREAQQLVLSAADAVPSEGESLLSARLAALTAAAERVAPIAASGDPQRQSLALRLQAEIASAQAQAYSLQGNDAAAALRADLTRLLAEVDSAERDSARSEKLRLNPTPAIATLQKAETANASDLQASRANLDRLAEEQAAAEQAIAEARQNRAAAASKEASLADAAFLQAGDEKQQTLAAASAARSQADAAESQERRATITLDQLKRRAELESLQAELARGGTERLREVSRTFSEAGVAAEAAVTEAQRSATAAATAAAESAQSLHDGVQARVLEPLTRAAEAAGTAVERLSAASAEAGLLAEAQLAHAQAITDAVAVSNAFAKGLSDAAARLNAVAPAAGQAVSQLATSLQQEAAGRSTAAAEALASGVQSLQGAAADAPGTSTLREVASRLDARLKANAG